MIREEEILLENMRDDMKRMRDDTISINKNILYLCRHVISTESRLKSIETILAQQDIDLAIYRKKVNQLEGKLIGFSAFIAVGISLFIQVVM